jgi:hypothetical protein
MQKEIDLYNLPPMKFMLIPDYKENESIMVCIAHHSFIDGVQGWSLF